MTEPNFDALLHRKIEPTTVPYNDPDDLARSLPEFVPVVLKPTLCHQAALAGSTAVGEFLRSQSSLSDFQISEICQAHYQDLHYKLTGQHTWVWQNIFEAAVNRGEVNDPRTSED